MFILFIFDKATEEMKPLDNSKRVFFIIVQKLVELGLQKENILNFSKGGIDAKKQLFTPH